MAHSCFNLHNIFSPTGLNLAAKKWETEARMRLAMNNLCPDIVEKSH